jgi:hypothetical protein
MGPSVLINSALSRGEQTFCSDLNDSRSKKDHLTDYKMPLKYQKLLLLQCV